MKNKLRLILALVLIGFSLESITTPKPARADGFTLCFITVAALVTLHTTRQEDAAKEKAVREAIEKEAQAKRCEEKPGEDIGYNPSSSSENIDKLASLTTGSPSDFSSQEASVAY